MTVEYYDKEGNRKEITPMELPASMAAGDVFYYDGSAVVRLAKGTAGQVLTMNTGATAPEWATP